MEKAVFDLLYSLLTQGGEMHEPNKSKLLGLPLLQRSDTDISPIPEHVAETD
jgi:hypothetical protein